MIGGGGVDVEATDEAVVVRGRLQRFGGPLSEIGAVAARAVRSALDDGIRQWLERRR